MNTGALLLDLPTISSAPRFFALLSLVLRAAGYEVVVMGLMPREKGEPLAASFGIPFNRVVSIEEYKPHQQKLDLAKTLAGPVIWVDNDFANWKGQDVSDYPEIVTLNWQAVLKNGATTGPGLA